MKSGLSNKKKRGKKKEVYFLIKKYADGSAGSKLCIVVNCLDHALEGAATLLTCIFRYCSSESLKLSWLFWWPGINSEVTEQQQKVFSLSASTYAIRLNFKSCMIDNVMCIGVKMFFTALSKLQSFLCERFWYKRHIMVTRKRSFCCRLLCMRLFRFDAVKGGVHLTHFFWSKNIWMLHS